MNISLKKSTDANNVTELHSTHYDSNMQAIEAALNGLPVIEAGAAQTSAMSAGDEVTISVTFSKTFTNQPSVALTPNCAGGRIDVGVMNVTTTGFEISVKAVIAGTYWVHWIAVERK